MAWKYLKAELCTKDIYRQIVKTKSVCMRQALEVLDFVITEIIYNISAPLSIKLKELYPNEKWEEEFHFRGPALHYNILIELTNEAYAANNGGHFRQFCIHAVRNWVTPIFEMVMSRNTSGSPSKQLIDHFVSNIDEAHLSYYADLFEDAINFKWRKLMMARTYILHLEDAQVTLYRPRRYNEL